MAFQVAGRKSSAYENRILEDDDFDDDQADGGELGAGHAVTALYEVVPHGVDVAEEVTANMLRLIEEDDDLIFQTPDGLTPEAASDDLLHLAIRYKRPEDPLETPSTLLTYRLADPHLQLSAATPDFLFVSAVAAFGMLLRDSPYAGDASLSLVRSLAVRGQGDDPEGYRAELVELIDIVTESEAYVDIPRDGR